MPQLLHWSIPAVFIYGILFPALLLMSVAGCQSLQGHSPAPPPEIVALNAALNRHSQSCPRDYCLDHWPTPTELEQLDAWDCKAYAVAKADRLIHQYRYDPDRLEYILVEGAPLHVAHAALLVDGRWVLDSGLRCQVCALEPFTAGLRITGRLPVADLPYVTQAQAAGGGAGPAP